MLGGQFAINLLAIYGRQQANIDARITGALGPFGFATERSFSDSIDAFGDIFVQPTLRWNQGVHNYMVYAMANAPIGAYDSKRIVNMGLGHAAIDAGGGYTYFNPQTGWEGSGVLGFSYNFENTHIDLSERCGHALRLGHFEVHIKVDACGPGRVRLSAAQRR